MGSREPNVEASVPRWLEAGESAGGQAPPPWAVDLVRSADPICVTPTQMRRVLLRAGEGQQHRRAAWLRPLVVGAFLLGGTTVASAAFSDWPSNLVRACRGLVAHPASSATARPQAATRRAAVAAPDRHEGVLADEGGPASVELAAPAPVVRHAAADARVRSRVHAGVGLAEDPALVVEATRALRVARDPRRARLLATRYLHEHAGGALAEEAQAIVVEAAVAHQDDDAAAQAAQYLALYPHGSFRAAAERAVSAR